MRLTLTSLALAAALALPGAAPAEGLDLSKMTDAERQAFRQEVRAYLLENPEVIFEAIQILEERRNRQAAAADKDLVSANADAIFDDGHSWVGGNPDGDVTIVEWLDYRCGYCKRAHPVVEELLDRDPNIRIVIKEFPILGPDSVKAGRMALAALKIDPSKYRELNDALMTYEGGLTESAAYQIAASLGYEIVELKALAETTEISDILNENYQLAQVLGLQGTPAFIIGDQVIRGFLPMEDMVGVIAQARAASN